ncbi:TPA: hypothetical protein ACJIW3_004490 [Enterobacter hormaechei]
MATLKEHQAAMVDLLANGSGIPASASRLAHAMHDVLNLLSGKPDGISVTDWLVGDWGTTPGLNDKAISKPQKAMKTDSHAKWPTPAEQRVKELENTIRQLKANNAKLRQEVGEVKCDLELKLSEIRELRRKRGGPLPGHTNNDELLQEIAGLRQQIADSAPAIDFWNRWSATPPDQAGCRKPDTQVCEHDWVKHGFDAHSYWECIKCGATKL